MTAAEDIVGVPLFQGEVSLLGWAETSTRGKTVTFALDVDAAPDGHPFKGLGTGKYGQKFMLVAVPVTDSGRPSSPGASTSEPASATHGESPSDAAGGADASPSTKSAPAPGEHKPKRERTLAEKVGMTCNDALFWKWLGGTTSADAAATRVRVHCGVKSRADILPGTDAAKKWLALETQYLADTNQMAEAR